MSDERYTLTINGPLGEETHEDVSFGGGKARMPSPAELEGAVELRIKWQESTPAAEDGNV